MIEAVCAYLALLREPPGTPIQAWQALAEALDRLACAYHSTACTFDEDARDPIGLATYVELRELAAAAFPDFGFYAVVRPGAGVDAQGMLGDAIDDLADIAVEMMEVEWRWNNNGPADAAWQFHVGYAHWARHLIDLRGYVHTCLFEGGPPAIY